MKLGDTVCKDQSAGVQKRVESGGKRMRANGDHLAQRPLASLTKLGPPLGYIPGPSEHLLCCIILIELDVISQTMDC